MQSQNNKSCSEFPSNEKRWMFVKVGQIALGGLSLASALLNAREHVYRRGIPDDAVNVFIQSVEKTCKIHGRYTLKFAEDSVREVDWHIEYTAGNDDFLHTPKEWANRKS